MSPDPRFCRTRDIAARCGLSESWFNNSRVSGNGPPYFKVGSAVLYDTRVVEQWFAERQRNSTSQPS